MEYKNLNDYYNEKKKNFFENDINNNSKLSKLSEELLEDINNEGKNMKNNKNFLYIKEYSNHTNRFRKPSGNFSEGKLYCRKNIRKRLCFNEDPYSTKKNNNINFTYSSYLKSNISFKK